MLNMGSLIQAHVRNVGLKMDNLDFNALQDLRFVFA
jgi:hypothetical protein